MEVFALEQIKASLGSDLKKTMAIAFIFPEGL